MIRREILDRIRLSTCAITRLERRHEEVFADMAPDAKVSRPPSKVVGTGFLVRDDLVLTNRHLTELIAVDHGKSGTHDNWYLEFTYPRANGMVSSTFVRINHVFAFIDPKGQGSMDVGLVDFTRTREPGCGPLVEVVLARMERHTFGAATAAAVG